MSITYNQIDRSLLFAQRLTPKFVYTIEDAIAASGSRSTAFRNLKPLIELGIVENRRGKFIINNTLKNQPNYKIKNIIPSLKSLKQGIRFGRHYNNSDISFALENVNYKQVTLDYKAWELTKFQTPSDLYLYVEDFDYVIEFMKKNNFHEGKKGHVVILPMIGDFENEIQRTYLDCIAKGGRSINDAIAIELLYSNKLDIKADFSTESVLKVQEDLPRNKF